MLESETCTHKVQQQLEKVTTPSIILMVVLSVKSNSMMHNFKTSQESDLLPPMEEQISDKVTTPSINLMVVLAAKSHSMTHNFKTSQELDLS